jgi:MYXO-CTERM domain-containing protein
MDAPLPRRIDAPLYARTGDGGVFLLIGIALIFMVRRRLRYG